MPKLPQFQSWVYPWVLMHVSGRKSVWGCLQQYYWLWSTWSVQSCNEPPKKQTEAANNTAVPLCSCWTQNVRGHWGCLSLNLGDPGFDSQLYYQFSFLSKVPGEGSTGWFFATHKGDPGLNYQLLILVWPALTLAGIWKVYQKTQATCICQAFSLCVL